MFLPRRLPAQLAPRLFGMNGYPSGLLKEAVLEIDKISRLVLFVSHPDVDHVFKIGSIRASGTFIPPAWVSMRESEFFRMIDEFGQFIHKDWPRKTHSVDDLKKYFGEEDRDLARNPGPDNWDKFGGWKAGPQLTPTGYFRVEKYHGQWWLVDPEGRLFWSHGSHCVRSQSGVTPITDRNHLFRGLPDQGSPFAQFYGQSSWAPQNYYKGKGTYETYNFQGANLLGKYGSSWPEAFAEISHRRLRSWGMNTIANWSDEKIYLQRKTPYMVAVGFGGKLLEGSQGYWGKFKDVFDPHFEEEIRKGLARQKGKSAGDPWCDVISDNLYVRDVENFRLPQDIDRPVIVGEFHFGALDRGMFHTGLRETESQAERTAAYKRYVDGALRNPLIIGTHWFQYSDQATTGRGDGENYQIGFLDIADTPYLETIELWKMKFPLPESEIPEFKASLQTVPRILEAA